MPEISDQQFKARVRFMHDLLEKVIHVNSFFITAGYGTFFGVWAVIRDELTHASRIWSCLFLLGSAALFIFWQLYSLFSMNVVVKAIAQDPADSWVERIKAAVIQRNAEIIQRWGIPITLLSAALGLIGISILATGLIRAL